MIGGAMRLADSQPMQVRIELFRHDSPRIAFLLLCKPPALAATADYGSGIKRGAGIFRPMMVP